MSRKSAAVGTGAMAFNPLVDILTLAQRGEYGYKWSRGTGMNSSLVAVGVVSFKIGRQSGGRRNFG